jgi:hypothetical protein
MKLILDIMDNFTYYTIPIYFLVFINRLYETSIGENIKCRA